MEYLTIQYYLEQVATISDIAAFEKLYYHYYSKLMRFACAIIKQKELAEEVVSDVFVNLWRNRSRLLEIDNLNSYLYIMTRNQAIRKMSQHKSNSTFSIDDIDMPLQSQQASPEHILLNKELLKNIEGAIESLPSRCRTIYRLAKQDGLKYKEIASLLNLSVKTIDAQMAIAVRRITQALKYNLQEGVR